MAVIVDLKKEVRHKFVYELRFNYGQIYWNRDWL